jgi:hypothetical protein
MSDVPELDRLLDEHRNYETNMRFMRQERLFMWLCRVSLTIVAATLRGLLNRLEPTYENDQDDENRG